jgi:hypothetical protein
MEEQANAIEPAADTNDPVESDNQALITWLRDRNAHCPLCDYNVRNLTTPRCPECGQMLRLTVALAEPYLKAWITLLVSLCPGAGMGVLWLWSIFMTRGRAPWQLWVAVTIHILMIPAVFFALRYRRQFMRLSRTQQRGLAFFALGLMIFSYGWIFFVVK